MHFYPSSFYFLCLRSKWCPEHIFKSINLCSSFGDNRSSCTPI
jgi:hypothetical protein